MQYLIIMPLHNYHRNGNPCHFQVVRMRIVLQKSIDSGTIAILHIYIFYNLTTVDRGCQPLLVAHQRCIYQKSTQLATAVLPAPTISCYYFYFIEAIKFHKHAEAPSLLAAEASLDILGEETKTAEVFCLYEDRISNNALQRNKS